MRTACCLQIAHTFALENAEKSQLKSKSNTGSDYPLGNNCCKQATESPKDFVQFCCRPPRRGTWIEIDIEALTDVRIEVVPRVGGRGLKYHLVRGEKRTRKRRPPRRGTWIEIVQPCQVFGIAEVVPRVGGRGLK